MKSVIKAVIFDMFETLVSLFAGRTYFGENIAADVGIDADEFRAVWHKNEFSRSIGRLTIEEALSQALSEFGITDEKSTALAAEKRRAALDDTFSAIPEETFAMLDGLKRRGLLIGLISNCFSDECEIIKASPLFGYFDSAMLSYEQGICKPDKEIYLRIMKELGVMPQECLYVGDGGSRELFAADELGMKAVQAEWFRRYAFEPHIPCPVYPQFLQAQKQEDIFGHL